MNEKAQIIITEFDEVDQEQYCNLHKVAFSEMFRQNKITENNFTVEYFNWKYNTPWGKAKLAIAKLNGRIVGGVSMLPFQAIYQGNTYKVWHTGDVAVLPEFQGRFFFNQSMTALRNEVAADTFIFGFPNHNNLSGAKRAGFPGLKELCFFIKPILFRGFGSELIAGKSFDSLQDLYADVLAAKGGAMLHRSATYMNWRYVDRPGGNYFIYNYLHDETIKGNVVARAAMIKGIRVLIVMEYNYVEKNAVYYLNQFLKQTASKNRCLAAVLISSPEKNYINRSGFIRLPEKLQPRKITLVGNTAQKETHPLIDADWFCQTGDWDAF